MSPFRTGRQRTWMGYLRDRAGRRHRRSLGTANRHEAALVEAWVEAARAQRRWDVLEAVIGRAIAPFEAWALSQEGQLDAWLANRAAAAARDSEPDADQLVAQWALVARSEKYVQQVRQLVVAGRRFPLSGFTRAVVSAHLAGLPASGPTKNRHRVAFSQFASWLVERDLLSFNFVRDIRGYRERDPRMVHYQREEAKAVIRRLPMPLQALEAAMAGAGLEWSAAIGLRRRDVDIAKRELAVRGTKTRWRTRTVRVTEDWCWDILEGHVRRTLPDAPLFPGIKGTHARRLHVRACEAAGVPVSTLHDWRHTYAIQALRDGLPAATIKRQLGHSPHSTMLERVYGAYIPTSDLDYVPRLIVPAPQRAVVR